jgi:hypothetical protein
MEELQRLRSFPIGAGVLGDDYIISLGAELLRTLRQGQNQIGADSESRLLELFQATFYYVRIAVDKKNAERTAPVRGTFRAHTPPRRLELVLSQV